MKKLSELFDRARGRQAKEIKMRLAVIAAVKEAAGIDLNIASVSFSGTKAVLRGLSPAERSVIFMKKPSILGRLAGQDLGPVASDLITTS